MLFVPNPMKPFLISSSILFLFALLFFHPLPAQNILISGVVDGPLDGGTPKAVELYVQGDIADLSEYGLGSANNGGGSSGQEFNFPEESAQAGQFIYVSLEEQGFTSFFGFKPDLTDAQSGALSINGNDAIELYFQGAVIDVFGDVNQDGSGQPWEYQDGWARRVSGTGPDGNNFNENHWYFSGPNAFGDDTTNSTATIPFPLGKYSTNFLYQESFETEPGFNYSLSDPFDTGEGFDFFNRFEVPVPPGGNSAQNDYENGWHENFGILGQDHDGQGGAATRTIALSGIPVEGLAEIQLLISLGALDREPEFFNYDVSDGDGIEIFASLDGNNRFLVGRFAPNASESDLYLDVNLDGIGDGARLTTDLTDFEFTLPGTGSELTLEIELTSTANFESLAVDNVRIRDAQGRMIDTLALAIHEIQGPGMPLPQNAIVEVEAIVTGDFQDSSQLEGFFIQEEDLDADSDPQTSEGILVFCGTCPTNVSLGDEVRVTGLAREQSGMTIIDVSGGEVVVLSAGNDLPTPTVVSLPAPASTRAEETFENLEGMLVRFSNTLVISEYFQLARFGQIVLHADNRVYQFTHTSLPGTAGLSSFLAELNKGRIILDDDNNREEAPLPDGTYFFPTPNGFGLGEQGADYFRGGDQISNLTGIMHWSGAGASGTDAWRIRPVPDSFSINIIPTNGRTSNPPSVGGDIQVAAFNVLNYFTTIDEGDHTAGPQQEQPRGAHSPDELQRQTQKLVSALLKIDADVVGLTELENNGDLAIGALVDALNQETGSSTYAFVSTGVIGQDVIATGLIYQPGVVRPVGEPAVLTSSEFLDPNGFGRQLNRPAVAATFEVSDPLNPAFGEVFTVVVNHFKSKGNSGVNPNSPDADQGDGQGNWNDTRTRAAQALLDWLEDGPTGTTDPDVLILGDLNAYRREDPIRTLIQGGYEDLVETFEGEDAYSFVFDGQLGYLDYILASPDLALQVVGTSSWHINADEVNVFDYNNTIVDGNEPDFAARPTGNPLFEGNVFRSSDHDPIIVGLDLEDSLTSIRPIRQSGADFGIFPNPSKGAVTLDLGGYLNQRIDIRLTDSQGRLIWQQRNLEVGMATYPIELDRLNLADGFYQLEVTSKQGVRSKSLKVAGR